MVTLVSAMLVDKIIFLYNKMFNKKNNKENLVVCTKIIFTLEKDQFVPCLTLKIKYLSIFSDN